MGYICDPQALGREEVSKFSACIGGMLLVLLEENQQRKTTQLFARPGDVHKAVVGSAEM